MPCDSMVNSWLTCNMWGIICTFTPSHMSGTREVQEIALQGAHSCGLGGNQALGVEQLIHWENFCRRQGSLAGGFKGTNPRTLGHSTCPRSGTCPHLRARRFLCAWSPFVLRFHARDSQRRMGQICFTAQICHWQLLGGKGGVFMH